MQWFHTFPQYVTILWYEYISVFFFYKHIEFSYNYNELNYFNFFTEKINDIFHILDRTSYYIYNTNIHTLCHIYL